MEKKPQFFGKEAPTFRQRSRNFLEKKPQLFRNIATVGQYKRPVRWNPMVIGSALERVS